MLVLRRYLSTTKTVVMIRIKHKMDVNKILVVLKIVFIGSILVQPKLQFSIAEER